MSDEQQQTEGQPEAAQHEDHGAAIPQAETQNGAAWSTSVTTESAKVDQAALLQALANVQDELVLGKVGVNPHFNSSYVPLPVLLESVRPVLRKHGFVDVFRLEGTNSDGMNCAWLDLHHLPSGLRLTAFSEVPLARNDPQGWGATITYQRRYMLTSLLGLVEEDDDGNKASDRGKGQQKGDANRKKPAEDKPAEPDPFDPEENPRESAKAAPGRSEESPREAPKAERKAAPVQSKGNTSAKPQSGGDVDDFPF